ALLAWRALERLAKSDAGVSDGNNDDAPTEPLRPAIRLHHHPAATPCMLDDVLADLGEGHREAHRRLRIEVELAQYQLGLLLNAPDDVVHVLALRDARDLEEPIRHGAGVTLREVAAYLILPLRKSNT